MDGTDISHRWSFGGESNLATQLLELVISGQKTATTGIYLEHEVCGKVGACARIYDELTGNDLCIIEYTQVTILPFLEVGFDHIEKEGEGEKDIESWRVSHRNFFQREYPGSFSDASLVVCEEFRVIKNLTI